MSDKPSHRGFCHGFRSLGGGIACFLRISMAIVFLYAGLAKIGDTETFAWSIRGYDLPLWGLEDWVARILPVFEIVCALALFLRPLRRLALLSLGVLCLVFLFVLAQAALRGLSVDCGCFGAGGGHEKTLPEDFDATDIALAIVRDVFFLGALVWLYRFEVRMRRPDGKRDPGGRAGNKQESVCGSI
ncbi:MAG: DoxX family membrane protein [Puniceicoccales bacterium]|jgi:uncharacterized membrane protein YphA (DoxX/SURF4 family)|nr:DoxX family membrane protein [Puniceicoccales bacterium]